MVGSCYTSSVCYQAAPSSSDQGADLGQHIWGLDTRMLDDVGKLLDFFFFDPTTRFILHLPVGECALFDSQLRPWTGFLLGRSSAFLLLSDPGTM